MDLKVHVDWTLKEMKALLGAGPEVMLIALWQIIWFLVQTQCFVRDKPQGWWTSLLETGDFKKINIWFVRWELLVAFDHIYCKSSKKERSTEIGKLRCTCKIGRKRSALTKRTRNPSVSLTFCCCNQTPWPEMTSRRKRLFWVPERKSIVAAEGQQQVTKSGSWENSALFTHRKQRERANRM